MEKIESVLEQLRVLDANRVTLVRPL